MSEKAKGDNGNRKTGNGSFWVSKKAIEAFTRRQPQGLPTATHIATFLVLARFSDESGRFSSAGLQAISTAIGITRQTAEKALAALQGMTVPGTGKTAEPILYSAESWAMKGGELPERPTTRSQVRWVLNDFSGDPEDRVWFSNELVDGYGKFKQPLKRLKQCGDVAARLLLIMYRENDMEHCGGVVPCRSAYKKYEMKLIWKGHKGYDFWTGEQSGSWATASAYKATLGIAELPRAKDAETEVMKPFWQALQSLESSGLIYEIVTVMDGPADREDSQPIYALHTKTVGGYKPHGEEGLAGHIARIMGDLGHPICDAQGRFYDKYGAVVPAGVTPHVIGIFRIRFRVSNPKNYGVRSAWSRIYTNQEEAMEWLEFIEGKGRVIPPETATKEQGGQKAEEVGSDSAPTVVSLQERRMSRLMRRWLDGEGLAESEVKTLEAHQQDLWRRQDEGDTLTDLEQNFLATVQNVPLESALAAPASTTGADTAPDLAEDDEQPATLESSVDAFFSDYLGQGWRGLPGAYAYRLAVLKWKGKGELTDEEKGTLTTLADGLLLKGYDSLPPLAGEIVDAFAEPF